MKLFFFLWFILVSINYHTLCFALNLALFWTTHNLCTDIILWELLRIELRFREYRRFSWDRSYTVGPGIWIRVIIESHVTGVITWHQRDHVPGQYLSTCEMFKTISCILASSFLLARSALLTVKLLRKEPRIRATSKKCSTRGIGKQFFKALNFKDDFYVKEFWGLWEFHRTQWWKIMWFMDQSCSTV